MTSRRFSPSTRVLGALAVAVCTMVTTASGAAAQSVPETTAAGAGATVPNRFAAGDSVDVEYFMDGDWLPARVIDVVNDGYAYEVELTPYNDRRTIRTQIHFKRVRVHIPAAGVTAVPALPPATAASTANPVVATTRPRPAPDGTPR